MHLNKIIFTNLQLFTAFNNRITRNHLKFIIFFPIVDFPHFFFSLARIYVKNIEIFMFLCNKIQLSAIFSDREQKTDLVRGRHRSHNNNNYEFCCCLFPFD